MQLFIIQRTVRSRSDALDVLYGSDWHRVVKAVLNGSFTKYNLLSKKLSRPSGSFAQQAEACIPSGKSRYLSHPQMF